jgi:(1->4)-alpha-D-glucan 1-alpha-D-glucosylmutase
MTAVRPGRVVGRAPVSTYRVQVTADFDLFAVAGLLPYLQRLGADWVYLSPILEAESGSAHGYDVVAHDRLDASRGGAPGLAKVSEVARGLGMGVLVDIVPNHMGVATPRHNAWWWDLLRHGQDSPHAPAFDVDWEAGGGRLRVPVVGDDDLLPDGRVGNLTVVGEELHYHDHAFPLAPGSGGSGEDADAVHARQHYELVGWREADRTLNYRRFFAVNTLAGIRVEDPKVFDDSHVEIRRWFDEDLVDGLRIDHPDGLRDPEGYLGDLAGLTGNAYVLVEKILEPGEALPATWPTEGTTGYDALSVVDRVLTDPAGEQPLDALETKLRGRPVDWHAMVHRSKRDVADGSLNSEVRRLVREAVAAGVDRPAAELEDAVAELLACFPVYRSYLPEGRAHLDEAFAAARAGRPELAEALDALEPVLADPTSPPALRFQQTSGMVMAKGVEDSMFYRWSRLTSLNEVGGDPSVFALDPAAFHGWCGERQHAWPQAMTTLSTHDTKRAEDVRARITALAELPETWAEALDRLLAAAPLPDPGFGSLLWQAVLGAWPASRERLHAYAEKAMREAGDHTTWTAPDEDYEKAVHAAVDAAFDDPTAAEALTGLVDALAPYGWSNALAAKLLALTMPGVPDVYQGSELWEQSLVDPDNRRAVDFDVRAAMLARLDAGETPRLSRSADDDGFAKLAVTRAALRLRRERPELFGAYAPLAAEGAAAGHALAFDRGGAVSVVTRLPVGLERAGGWGDTVLRLPTGDWVEQMSGRRFSGAVPLAELLADLPVALLAEDAR